MSVMPAMTMEQVQERASKEQKVRTQTERVRPMLSQDEEDGDDCHRRRDQGPRSGSDHSFTLLSLRELPITLTDDKAMAAAAMMGESRMPKVG